MDRSFGFEDEIRNGVVMMSEVALFEGNAGATDNVARVGGAVSTTERNTMLKLVIGMAMRGYGYDPGAARSDAPKSIADDLEALEISVTDDTIRKYLKEAVNTVLPAKSRKS